MRKRTTKTTIIMITINKHSLMVAVAITTTTIAAREGYWDRVGKQPINNNYNTLPCSAPSLISFSFILP
jgi:hypothetical protein